MALLLEADVRDRASTVTHSLRKSMVEARADSVSPAQDRFDVFLSHSSNELEQIILGVMAFLNDAGLSVYVDRYHDPQLSPVAVTKQTAAVLRVRMRQSRSLLYIHSQHSKQSRWMPWELGYFDAYRGLVGIIPVAKEAELTFKGEEYLGLYPYVDRAPLENTAKSLFWINESATKYAQLIPWVRGEKKIVQR